MDCVATEIFSPYHRSDLWDCCLEMSLPNLGTDDVGGREKFLPVSTGMLNVVMPDSWSFKGNAIQLVKVLQFKHSECV